ncbi:chemotaxis protein CheA [Hydrogenimonas thermophila]|uniref:Chemotaxis protein CheA n=1 Tax=Hydrogenimonas thermophila TaxID=223786 RepID=A0A1I5PGM5_9BACT|nr:chemotaxis protein CheA [Hydrogenimonas thermophila]SFP33244.1 two-component system, chemotaxis family, sensor kinase CheA [Hydrogenimonas thermophila]
MNAEFISMLDEYKAENDELLQNMEDALMQIQEEGMNDENINAVFRAAHTIKGSSGMFGIDYIVKFTHVAENLLDKIRNNKIQINDEIIDTLLSCKDHIQTLVDFVVDNPDNEPSDDITQKSNNLIEILTKYLDNKNEKEKNTAQNENITNNNTVDKSKDKTIYKIKIDFKEETFNHGFDLYSFINYLNNLGEIASFKTITTKVPTIDSINPTKCYLSFEIEFASTESESKIKDVFELAKDDCQIEIINPNKVTEKKDKKTDEIQKKISSKKIAVNKSSNSIRVDAEKVDSLINLIGEMVISNAVVMQKAKNNGNSDLIESISNVSRMLEELRENAMQIRMIPIGDTFKKYKRIVHDLANKLGKQIELSMSGYETELDKTVIEKISDPLVHLIRNSVDHGIETPDERVKNGKNPKGTIELNAYHDAGSIVIEIKDDGKGLDAEVILQKGIEKGLVENPELMTQKEIFELILQPGFSTAKKVSDISGRGVGMDVVKRNITDLRGEIEIFSEKGHGTRILIRLPLTLAIIDGFLTKVSNTYFVIPLDMVIECIELTKAIKEEMRGNNYINLRGKVLPVLDLNQYFKIDKKNPTSKDNVVVVNYAGKYMGILVQELLGELQTVIKPLGQVFKNLNSLSGSTILGNGEVALILDIPSLLKDMEKRPLNNCAA